MTQPTSDALPVQYRFPAYTFTRRAGACPRH